jgi:hypothetical protein
MFASWLLPLLAGYFYWLAYVSTGWFLLPGPCLLAGLFLLAGLCLTNWPMHLLTGLFLLAGSAY